MINNFNDFINQVPFACSSNFFFIQIGGFDGVFDDPLHKMIIKHHWSGLIVEPQPEAFCALQKNYANHPNITLIQAAISNNNEPIVLHRLSQKNLTEEWKNCFATLLPDRGDIGKTPADQCEKIIVPGISLSTLLQQHQVKKIGLMQIDTEGYDYQILKSIDFTKLKPKIIHYEHRHLPSQEIELAQKLLKKYKYIISPLEYDTIAYQTN